MPNLVHGLRPRAYASFVPPPKKINGVWVWEGIRIIEKEGLGKHLQMYRPQAGLLVPYGGVQMTRQSLLIAKKVNLSRRPNLEYICDSGGEVIYDSCPTRIPLEPNAWPACYLNEACASSTAAKFNCEIVVLKTSDYPEIPDYPNIEKGEYMQFVEVMTRARYPEGEEGWIDMWLYYGEVVNIKKAFKMRGYEPKAFTLDNKGPQYKLHWTRASERILTAELGQKKLEEEEEMERRNRPIPRPKHRKGRNPPSQLGKKVPKRAKKRYRSLTQEPYLKLSRK